MGIVDKRWGLTPRDRDVPAWKDAPDKEWQERRMEVYAAQIDRMDQNVGRILDALRSNGQEDNTLVLFLADNGGCAEDLTTGQPDLLDTAQRRATGARCRRATYRDSCPAAEDTFQSYGTGWANASNTPFRLYKHWVHEGGISTPLIARWPKGITRPQCDHPRTGPSHRPDGHVRGRLRRAAIRPARGSAITPMEGRSLRPAFGGKPIRRDDAIYWEHEGNRAVLRRQMEAGVALSRTAGSYTISRPTAANCTTSPPLTRRESSE